MKYKLTVKSTNTNILKKILTSAHSAWGAPQAKHVVTFVNLNPWNNQCFYTLGYSSPAMVSSLTSPHYFWRSLGPFSLPCAQKWP